MRSKLIILFSVMLIPAFLTSNLWGEIKSPDHSHGQNIIKLNNILVDKIKKEIRISAKLAVTEGILEYLLVGNHGKTYESVFKIGDNKPSELNFALLLIGCSHVSSHDGVPCERFWILAEFVNHAAASGLSQSAH